MRAVAATASCICGLPRAMSLRIVDAPLRVRFPPRGQFTNRSRPRRSVLRFPPRSKYTTRGRHRCLRLRFVPRGQFTNHYLRRPPRLRFPPHSK